MYFFIAVSEERNPAFTFTSTKLAAKLYPEINTGVM
jgi:hypothetical protein